MRVMLASMLIGAAIWLCACPARQSGQQNASGDTKNSHPQGTGSIHDEFSLQAEAYLLDSLRDPAAEDHASLDDCWNIISRLPQADAFKAQLEQQVAQSQTQPGLELLSAWLASNPQAATEYVRGQLKEGNAAALQSLIRHPDIGKQLLLELDLSNQTVDFNDAVLLLIRSWGNPDPGLLPAFEGLAAAPEPVISLRAIGYLLRLGAGSEQDLKRLRDAISNDNENFVAAAEAGKISADERVATAFIPRLVNVALGEPDPELDWKSQPYFSAYALAYIPGSEAKLIRTRLLDAVNLDIRWQARFGELLQGDPASFQEAMLSEGILSPYIQKCTGPPEAAHPDLLPWLEKALAQATEVKRFQLASQLNRYNEHSSDPVLRKLVLGLLEDESSAIRSQGWLLAGQYGYLGRRVEAAGLLESSTEQASVKAAAACYLLLGSDAQKESGN